MHETLIQDDVGSVCSGFFQTRFAQEDKRYFCSTRLEQTFILSALLMRNVWSCLMVKNVTIMDGTDVLF